MTDVLTWFCADIFSFHRTTSRQNTFGKIKKKSNNGSVAAKSITHARAIGYGKTWWSKTPWKSLTWEKKKNARTFYSFFFFLFQNARFGRLRTLKKIDTACENFGIFLGKINRVRACVQDDKGGRRRFLGPVIVRHRKCFVRAYRCDILL